MTAIPFQIWVDDFKKTFALNQGIINIAGTETSAKEPKLAKILRELKLTPVLYNKKSPLVFLVCL